MLAEKSPRVSEESIRSEMLTQMKKILDEKNLGYVQFYVNFVKEILPDPGTGKKQLVITAQEEVPA